MCHMPYVVSSIKCNTNDDKVMSYYYYFDFEPQIEISSVLNHVHYY